MQPDVVVLGGGPGGYATALRATARGLRVVLVEAELVGGTCLHRGCVPSKALLHVGHLADQLTEMASLGLVAEPGALDVAAAGALRDRVVERLHGGLRDLLAHAGIEVVHGWGRVVEPGQVRVRAEGGDRTLEAAHVVVATGSAPVDLPHVAPDGQVVLRSDDALRLARVPRTGVVIGGGAIGVEVASLWRSLGAAVTIVEAVDRLLPLEDPDSSAALRRALEGRGIEVRTGTGVQHVGCEGAGAQVVLDDGVEVHAEQVLVAVGRRPSTAGIGLEELGVLDGRGFVEVDALGRTTVEGLWAVGDAVPTLALAHAAYAEGFVVADAIAGLDPTPVDHALVPRVTYCSPEVASVGLTEPQARRAHDDVCTTTSPFAGNTRARIEGAAGHVKLVHGGDGVLLGAHVVGPSATELIAELTAAVAWEGLVSELGELVHAHPTLSEAVHEAALAAAGVPFHLPAR